MSSSKKIRVLYFVDRMLGGGIQSLVTEIAKYINKNDFQLDFLLLDDGKKYSLENTLKELGCNVYKLEKVWINTPIDYINYYRKLKKFFKDKGINYDIVHLHSSSKNFLVLYFAKKNGVKIRIAHAHTTDFQTKSKLKIFVGNFFKYLLKKYTTNFMACSKEAGTWLFGEKTNIVVLKNAIDVEKFKYNETEREKIRNKYDIAGNEIVCGNVGRFVAEKNHPFLLDIFYQVHKKKKNYKLLLVGTGTEEEEDKLRAKVKELQIEDSVIFAGFQENVNLYYNAMDIFVFPSIIEGLGIVIIEAQANGLQCIISDTIPQEVKMTEKVKVISLKDRKKWIDTILSIEKNRFDNIEDINNKGYNILHEIKNLEEYYKEILQNIS